MTQIRNQVDDQKEFELLVDYLRFDKSLKEMQQIPKALKDLEASFFSTFAQPVLAASCVDAIRSAAGLDMQIEEMINEYSQGNSTL